MLGEPSTPTTTKMMPDGQLAIVEREIEGGKEILSIPFQGCTDMLAETLKYLYHEVLWRARTKPFKRDEQIKKHFRKGKNTCPTRPVKLYCSSRNG